MTAPMDFEFEDDSAAVPAQRMSLLAEPEEESPLAEKSNKLPPPIIEISEEQRTELCAWLDEEIQELEMEQGQKLTEWKEYEEAYRARPQAYKTMPFEGACNDVVPAIAMGVDPVVARLDIGIFKQDPVLVLKALKKSFVPMAPSLNAWVQYYQKHKLRLRKVMLPRIVEYVKLGTMAMKTIYDREEYTIKTYDPNTLEVVDKVVTRFKGPRVLGVAMDKLLFHPGYESVQDCPIVVEVSRPTYWDLKIAEASGKLGNVDKVKDLEDIDRNEVETARQEVEGHVEARLARNKKLKIYEVWCDYDIDGNGLPERLVITYHKDTRTILQLRYNWYFHQRKPYTVIPYMVTNDSLYGMGLCEMTKFIQDSVTKWHQMATDNAYLANIRMFIVKRDAGIEEVPRLYTGRCFFVDEPKSDFIPFQVGDIYPSTLTERQNLMGLMEKRTGVSDYLTGRESPIIGSRATATTTLALIEQGTKRVEEVLENLRQGIAEVIENCFYIWFQYGTDDLSDIVFGDDKIGEDVMKFFQSVDADNVNGAIAIDLAAADAGTGRQAMQQMQLQIIQVMMQYLEKVLTAGAEAMKAEQAGMPQFTAMVAEVMAAARKMFEDLLHKYDIRNPEDYLPDLEKFLNAGQTLAGAEAGPGGLVGGPTEAPGLPVPAQGFRGPAAPTPAQPGTGGGLSLSSLLAGAAQGPQGTGR